MLIKRIALLLILFILSLPASVLAAEAGSGIIEGQIVNGTAGGSSVADQDITLKTYLNDAEAGSTTTKAGAEGRFVFAGLSTDPNYSYQVTLTFQEADYYGDRLSFAEGETTKSTEVTVYDSTMSDEAIKVTVAHTVIYVEQGSLHVEEYFTFVNESDRTYIGSGEITATGTRRTLRLPLPAKMTELQYGGELMECCVLPDEEGFFDTMPVLPGSKEIAYSYKVDYKSGVYTFSQDVNYPTVSYNLLVQGGNVESAEGQLTRREPVNIEGNQFNYLSGENLAPGDAVVAQLSGLPQATNQRAILWVVLTVLVLGVAFGILYLPRRNRLQPVSPKGSLDQRGLLVELAQLDDAFEDGKVSEEAYRRRRAKKKAQLVELRQRPKRGK